MSSKSSEKWFFPAESGVMGGAAGKGGKKRAVVVSGGRAGCVPEWSRKCPEGVGRLPPDAATFPVFEGMALWGDLIGELLADEAEGRAEQHEAGANQEDLQSDIHKNSLSFVRAGRHAGRGAGRGASSAYPCGCASLTHGRCALNADPDCRNDYKEIRWRGGAPGRGSMPRISASRGRRRSAHESVLSERV